MATRTRTKPKKENPLRALRAAYGLNQAMAARVMGVSIRTVASLEARDLARLPREVEELKNLLDALADIMRPTYIATWLDSPSPGFQGLKPLEVIDRGRMDWIWSTIYHVGSGDPY